MVATQGQARDFTDIATELARRTGLAEKYVAAINKGAGGVPLKGEHGDFSLDPQRSHSRDEIWDAVCRAASAEISDGAHAHGLDWWKVHGLATKPFARRDWYLLPTLVEHGLRFELPYQERLLRVGTELGRRLHEHDMHWWDEQLKEYQGLPVWKDFPALWEAADRPGRWPRRGLSVLAADGAQHAVRLGRECRHATDEGGRRQRHRSPRRDHQCRRGRATGHRRRRPDRDRDPQAQRARPRGGAPGYSPRHPAADRPVRSLGHAGGQRFRRAEHELAGDDVAGADRCHGLGRSIVRVTIRKASSADAAAGAAAGPEPPRVLGDRPTYSSDEGLQ